MANMIKMIFATVLSALCTTPVAAQDVHVDGCAAVDNHDSIWDAPFAHTGVPLLSAFWFDLRYDRDNNLRTIMVMPDLPPGMIRLAFGDKDPQNFPHNDDYCFHQTYFDIARDPGIQQQERGTELCDTGREDFGECKAQLIKPAGDFVFVLIGFVFGFQEDNHDSQIKKISILEDNGWLTVAFHDKEWNSAAAEKFLWNVKYAYVPADQFSDVFAVKNEVNHHAKDQDIHPIPRGAPILSGFSFTYTSDEHKLRQIGMRPNQEGAVFVNFRDKSPDKEFDWEYRGAILKPFVLPAAGGYRPAGAR